MHYEAVTINDAAAIKELSALATEIVREHFDPLIGTAQNDYMIRKFQSVEAIMEQLEQGYQYYFVCGADGGRVGFLAFYPVQNKLYLSKFYLHKEQRGKGFARNMLQFVIQQAQERELPSIVLNVNKDNSAALVYEKLGFKKIGAEKNDIGNGYYMDGWVYEYNME